MKGLSIVCVSICFHLYYSQKSIQVKMGLSSRLFISKIKPMPWPVTHILVTEKVYQRYFSQHDPTALTVGTCFPDIRYPAGLDREVTHLPPLALFDRPGANAFEVGMLFHNLVDNLWMDYIQEHAVQLFKMVPHSRATFHVLKIVQDQYLYPMFSRWPEVVDRLAVVLPEELTFGASQDAVLTWHSVLSDYLSSAPTQSDLRMLDDTLPPEVTRSIGVGYETLIAARDPRLQDILIRFYDDIERLIDAY